MDIVTHYQEGDAPYIVIEHYTYDLATDVWALANPDATFPKITLYDAAGTLKVAAVTILPTAAGLFGYRYIIPADPATGHWYGWIDTEDGTYPDRVHFGFDVE